MTLRLRPSWIFRTKGPFTYELGLSAERREDVNGDDEESRNRFRVDFSVIYEIEDSENFWELALRFEETDEDTDQDETLVSAGLFYTWYPDAVNGLELTAGGGYEIVDQEASDSDDGGTSESPFLILRASKRF